MALDRLARRMLTELRRDSRLSVQDPANRVGEIFHAVLAAARGRSKERPDPALHGFARPRGTGAQGMSARACHAAAPCRADCGGVRACGTGPAGGDRVLLDHDGRRGLHPQGSGARHESLRRFPAEADLRIPRGCQRALRWCCARSRTTPCRRWIESRPPPQLSRQPISAAVPVRPWSPRASGVSRPRWC